MHYRQIGDVPRHRHTQHRDADGRLFHEELMGEEGFSSDSSLLYHRGVPSAIVASEIWELPDQRLTPQHPLAPRHLRLQDLATPTDAVAGRRLVLGNHDFYGGTFAGVDGLVDAFCAGQPRLRHLGKDEVVELTKTTALVGHRGWADGRAGSGVLSPVMLNDFVLIGDLRRLSRHALFAELAALGDASADYFHRVLPDAMTRFKHVFVLTHVPPFPQAAWHEGRHCERDYLPHFCNAVAGQVLAELAQRFPRCRLTVLCGHTHGEGTVRVARNLVVHTGGATYGEPGINRVFRL